MERSTIMGLLFKKNEMVKLSKKSVCIAYAGQRLGATLWRFYSNLLFNSSACDLNFEGFDFLRRDRLCNFHCTAGSCARCGIGSNAHSGVPATRLNRKRLCSFVSATRSSRRRRTRASLSSASVTGNRSMPANSFSKAVPISWSREKSTSCTGRLWPAR